MAIKSFIKVWVILAKNNLQNQLLTPSSSVLFILGKLFNFVFSILIIFSIFNQVSTIKAYTLPQAVIVVLIFNFIDSFTQFFFRSLYSFRPILLKGDFDLDLLKPLPSFFRPIFSGPDFLDVPLIVAQLVALVYFLNHFSLFPTPLVSGLFVLIFSSGVILAFSVHLLIASFCVMTTEVDSLVMIYRAMARAAVVPTDIYNGVFRFVLSYVVPITVIMTLPAKAILGILTPSGVAYSFITSFTFLLISLWFWKFSLRHYTSASS